MKTLIVDDEPLARRRLVRMLGRLIEPIEVLEAESAEEADELLARTRPDVIFLDIRMSGKSGLDFSRTTPNLPPVVFTTAYEEYALEAFEAAAVDYLLKPIRPERLEKSILRIRSRNAAEKSREKVMALLNQLDRRAEPERVAATPPTVAATHQGLTRIFDARELSRFWSHDKYTCFRHDDGEYLMEESLISLEARLAEVGFKRVHRSELVNLNFVTAVQRKGSLCEAHLRDGQTVRVSRRFLRGLQMSLGL